MWQEIIVGLCVLAAFGFVLYKYLPHGKHNSGGCDSCSGCGSSNTGCGKSRG